MTTKRARTPKKVEPKQQTTMVEEKVFTSEETEKEWKSFIQRLKDGHADNLRARKVIAHMSPHEWDEKEFTRVFQQRRTSGVTSRFNQTYVILHDDHLFVSTKELDCADVHSLLRTWGLFHEYLNIAGAMPQRELLRFWWLEGYDPSGYSPFVK